MLSCVYTAALNSISFTTAQLTLYARSTQAIMVQLCHLLILSICAIYIMSFSAIHDDIPTTIRLEHDAFS